MLEVANLPLYPSCETHTQMSIIGHIASLKTNFRILKKIYDEICQLITKELLKDNRMTSKKQMSALNCWWRRLIVVLMGI